MISYVLSFYNDLFMFLDTTIPSMTLEQRYQFLLQCVEMTKEKGVFTDKECYLRELKNPSSSPHHHSDDFINGRFLIHAMDYWVLTLLYIRRTRE